jgi:DNA-binding response OmpR family regulator
MPASPPPAGPPVAVIDDDIVYIRLVERLLVDEQVPVLPVTTLDVEEALHVIAGSGARAAIVDVYMYGETLGFSLVERLRAHPATASMPIVVVSGARKEIGRNVDFLEAHGCSIVLKPFDAEDLLEKLRIATPAAGAAAAAAPLGAPSPPQLRPNLVAGVPGGS